jgi:hypothetical protein
MLLQFLICLLVNHLDVSVDFSVALVQMNAAMLATGLFAFIAIRLRMAAQERQRRLAAALMIW